MLRAALNKRWQDHTSNNELYVNIPKITITIKEHICYPIGCVSQDIVGEAEKK